MSVTEKYDSLKFRLMTVERLRMLKKLYSYRELSRITGVPDTILCRYVKGAVIPSIDQAEKIWKALDKALDIKVVLRRNMNITSDGYIDLSSIISDPLIIEYIAHKAYSVFAGKRVTKILTLHADSMVLATALAIKFQVPLLVVRTRKESAHSEYYEKVVYIPPSTSITYYIPKHMLRRKDEVIIVDTVISSGKTLKALVDLVKEAKASVGGALALIAVGSEWRGEVQIPVEVFLEIPKHV